MPREAIAGGFNPAVTFAQSYGAVQSVLEAPERRRVEQEQEGLKTDVLKKQQAIGGLRLEQEKQESEWKKKSWDPSSETVWNMFGQDQKDQTMDFLRKNEFVDESGKGTMFTRQKFLEKLESDVSVFKNFTGMMEFNLKNRVSKIQEQIGEAENKGDYKKAGELGKVLIAEHNKLKGFQGKTEEAVNKVEIRQFVNDLESSGMWDKLPDPVKVDIQKAYRTGDKIDSIKEWVEQSLKPGTQKNANIHYETDTQGNVTKIVSDPISGETIRKEKMSGIGKREKPTKEGVEEGGGLKSTDVTMLKNELDRRYSSHIGVNPEEVFKYMNKEQKDAYSRIMGFAQKHIKTMSPVAAMDQALRDYENTFGKGGKKVSKEEKVLDEKTAKDILERAGGDKQKARQIAKQEGYKF